MRTGDGESRTYRPERATTCSAGRTGKDDLRVEVKGTTSAGHAVLLTRNEVANAKAQHPNVALVVVSHIRVDRTAVPPTASGGQLRVDDPWSLVETALEPLAFSYELLAH
jgi:hypothetical protein